MRHQIPVLNSSHPLNQGLISWWLVQPGQSTAQWADLCGVNPLTMQGSGVLGSASGRPGGRGAIVLIGATGADGKNTTVRRAVNVTAAQSESAWVYTDSTVGTHNILSLDAGGFAQAIALEMRSTTLRASASGGGAYVDSGITPAVTTWYHVLYTWDGTTNRIYINGVEAANSVTGHSSGVPDRIQVGETGFGEQWAGRLDDVRYWGRCLLPVEARQVYDNSRYGYPGLLVTTRRPIVRAVTAAVVSSAGPRYATHQPDHWPSRPNPRLTPSGMMEIRS